MLDTMRSCFKVALKNKFMVLGIILIPFLYAILYVDAFWNPVNQLENMPIAVINLDEGAEMSGEKVNYGDRILDELKNDDTVIWTEEDPAVFQNGIENTDYYMAFVIDKDFSTKVVAGSDGKPQQGKITYMVDKRKNFVISQYGNTIKTAFQDRISAAITKEYTETIYGGLKDMADRLDTAANGGAALDQGAHSAAVGVDELKNGADKVAGGMDKLSDNLQSVSGKMPALNEGVHRLSTGISAVSSGSSALSDGMNSVAGYMPLLVDGAGDISDGLSAASGKVDELSSGLNDAGGSVSKLADGVSAASNGVEGTASSVNGLIDAAIASINTGDYETAISSLNQAKSASSASASALAGNLSTVAGNLNAVAEGISSTATEVGAMKDNLDLMASGAASLSGNLSKLSTNVSALSGASAKLSTGISAMNSGAADLAGNVSTLSAGSRELASGALALRSGADQLDGGLTDLQSGLYTLSEGTDELAGGLREGADELDGSTVAKTEDMAKFVSDPVKTDEDSYGNADSYGMGFSPFFISLSCWLGSVLLFFVVPIRPQHPLKASRREMVFGPMPVFLSVTVLQSLFVSVGTLLVGVNVNMIPLLFLMVMVMSIAFALFVQFLNLAFGLPGRGFSIIILIFQLCACGGTFPVDLISRLFQIISPYMPFTYSVRGLKEIMFGSDLSVIFGNALVMIAFGLVSLLLSVIFYRAGIKHDKIAELV